VASVGRRLCEVLEIFVAREWQDGLDLPAGRTGDDRHLVGAFGEATDQANGGGLLCVERFIILEDSRSRPLDRGEHGAPLPRAPCNRRSIELVGTGPRGPAPQRQKRPWRGGR